MPRTRRSILRGASAVTAITVGAGTGAARSDAESGGETDHVKGANIRTYRRECLGDGEENSDVTRWLGGRVVYMTGTIPAPDPCHEAVIDAIDVEEGTMVVTVGVEADDGAGACTGCVGGLDYWGGFKLTDPNAIDDVEVVHADGGDGDEPGVDPDPATETTIETTGSDCRGGRDGSSTVRWEGGREVTVTGTIPASDPCHEAVIDSVEADGDTVIVTVGVEPDDDAGVCIQCLGTVEYRGTVTLTDPGPVEEIDLRHA